MIKSIYRFRFIYAILLASMIFISTLFFKSFLSAHAQENTTSSISQTHPNPIAQVALAENCSFSGYINLQSRADNSGTTFTVIGAETFSATTDASGYYTLAVPIGTYTLTAEMDLFLDAERENEPCLTAGMYQLPTVTLLGGDFNDDCIINVLDISFIGARFNLNSSDPNFDLKADINSDGTIDILDITVAGANFREECPVAWEGSTLTPTPTPDPYPSP